jgi:2,3-bisphosphoglycerate-dependent phosphoglycerate mutase
MAKTTELLLVRHAETTMIVENRIHGHSDGPLSESGLQDSQKAADYFRGQHFDAFYASSLGRAMNTAGIIGEAIQQKPVPVDNLRERYYGYLEGKSLEYFEPDGSGPWFTRPYVKLALWLTGESEQHFVKRVIDAIEEIVHAHQNQRILVVTHWGVLGILSLYLQGKDVSNWRQIGPWIACGTSEFHSNGQGWKTIRLDDGHYLK